MDSSTTSHSRSQSRTGNTRTRSGRTRSNSKTDVVRATSNSRRRSVSRNTLERRDRNLKLNEMIKLRHISLMKQHGVKTSELITQSFTKTDVFEHNTVLGDVIGFGKCLIPMPLLQYQIDSSDTIVKTEQAPYYTLSVTFTDKNTSKVLNIEKQLYYQNTLPGNIGLFEADNIDECIPPSQNVSLRIIHPDDNNALSFLYTKQFIDEHLNGHYKHIIKTDDDKYRVVFKPSSFGIFANIIR